MNNQRQIQLETTLKSIKLIKRALVGTKHMKPCPGRMLGVFYELLLNNIFLTFSEDAIRPARTREEMTVLATKYITKIRTLI